MPEERSWLTVAKGEEAKDNDLLDRDARGDWNDAEHCVNLKDRTLPWQKSMDVAVLVPQCKVSLINVLLRNEKVRRSCFSGDFGGLQGFLLHVLKFILPSSPSYSQERKNNQVCFLSLSYCSYWLYCFLQLHKRSCSDAEVSLLSQVTIDRTRKWPQVTLRAV